MPVLSHHLIIAVFWRGLALTVTVTSSAEAYIDPGTTGMLSQLLYILFYGVLVILLYCFRYIKQAFVNGKQYLAKLLAKRLTMIVSGKPARVEPVDIPGVVDLTQLVKVAEREWIEGKD